jgi:hypothetical protein
MTLILKKLSNSKSDTEQKKYILKQDSGTGIMFFSAIVTAEPIHEIELDCRGNISSVDGGYLISVGEIKSSTSGVRIATTKAARVFPVLQEALKVSLPSSGGSQAAAQSSPVVSKRLVVAIPKTERAFYNLPSPNPNFQLSVEFI